MDFIISLIILAIASYFQNMAFTASSRSRNSGDPAYHRKIAWFSNGIWFLTHFFVLRQVWQVFETGDWWRLLIVAPVYIFATSEGSVKMMKIMLKKETGKRKVGSG